MLQSVHGGDRQLRVGVTAPWKRRGVLLVCSAWRRNEALHFALCAAGLPSEFRRCSFSFRAMLVPRKRIVSRSKRSYSSSTFVATGPAHLESQSDWITSAPEGTDVTAIFLATFIAALLLSFIFTKLVRDVAIAHGWVAAPAQPRHLHIQALPRLGGLAIVFSFLIATGCALLVTRLMRPELSPSLRPLLTILAGAVLGFLRYNFNPATIFLGDCGSLFIGFMLSALALYGAQKAPTIIAVAIPVVSFGLPILETSLSVLRRFISGRPVFTADREHIHHKLLQRGMSHRQVVIVLYGVSAVFALLSLFLLWPTGSTLGLVLAVLGTGVWIGVQHLGYLEFGEIRRVAQRTIEQRQVFVNNLAIRRATEELKVAEDFAQVGRILTAAFDSNDFDSFELHSEATTRGFHLVDEEDVPRMRWQKPGSFASQGFGSAWSMTLPLVTTGRQLYGNLIIFRRYANRDLQLDINLLTSAFAPTLAEALHRTTMQNVEFIPAIQDPALLPAQAG